MKKIIFTILTLTILLLPTAVFASENTVSNTEHTHCDDFSHHIKMIKEKRLMVIKQYTNGEITQKEAVEQIKLINQMVNMHR